MSGFETQVLAWNRELCQASDKGPLVPELALVTALDRCLLVSFQVSWDHLYLEIFRERLESLLGHVSHLQAGEERENFFFMLKCGARAHECQRNLMSREGAGVVGHIKSPGRDIDI